MKCVSSVVAIFHLFDGKISDIQTHSFRRSLWIINPFDNKGLEFFNQRLSDSEKRGKFRAFQHVIIFAFPPPPRESDMKFYYKNPLRCTMITRKSIKVENSSSREDHRHIHRNQTQIRVKTSTEEWKWNITAFINHPFFIWIFHVPRRPWTIFRRDFSGGLKI